MTSNTEKSYDSNDFPKLNENNKRKYKKKINKDIVYDIANMPSLIKGFCDGNQQYLIKPTSQKMHHFFSLVEVDKYYPLKYEYKIKFKRFDIDILFYYLGKNTTISTLQLESMFPSQPSPFLQTQNKKISSIMEFIRLMDNEFVRISAPKKDSNLDINFCLKMSDFKDSLYKLIKDGYSFEQIFKKIAETNDIRRIRICADMKSHLEIYSKFLLSKKISKVGG